MTLDKKSKQQLQLTLGLLPVLLFVAVKFTMDMKKIGVRNKKAILTPETTTFPGGPVPPAGPGAAAAAHPAIAPDDLYEKLAKETQGLELERDPFSIYSPAKPQGVALNGIFWDDREPRVIIDGVLLRKGERIGKYVVSEIHKDRVILDDGQMKKELTIEF